MKKRREKKRRRRKKSENAEIRKKEGSRTTEG